MVKRQDDNPNYDPKVERKNGYVPWKTFIIIVTIVSGVIGGFFTIYAMGHSTLVTEVAKVEHDNNIINARLASIETSLEYIKTTQQRIETSLEEHKRMTEKYGSK